MSKNTILKSSKKRLLVCELGQRTFNLSYQNKKRGENEVSSGLAASQTAPRIYTINLHNDVTPKKKKKKSKNVILSPKVCKNNFPVKTQHQTKRNNKRNKQSSFTEPLSHQSEETSNNKKFNGIPVQNNNTKTIVSQKNITFSSEEQKENNLPRKNGQIPLNGFTKTQKPIQSKREIFVSNLEADQSWIETDTRISEAYGNLDVLQQPTSNHNNSNKDRNCTSNNQLNLSVNNKDDCMKKGKSKDLDKLTTEKKCGKNETMNNKTFNKLDLKKNQSTNLKQGFKTTSTKFVNPKRIQNEGNSLSKKPDFQNNNTKSNSNLDKLKPNKSSTSSVSYETHSSFGSKIPKKTEVKDPAKHQPHFTLKQHSTEADKSLKKCKPASKPQGSKDPKKSIKLNYKKIKDVPASNLPTLFEEQDSPRNIFHYKSFPEKKNVQRRVRRKDNNKEKMEEKKATELVLSLIEKIKREMQMLKGKREKGS